MFYRCYFCLILMVGLGVKLSNAQIYKKQGNILLAFKTIKVDPFGHGNFKTIQSAIDSIPSNNRYWTSIKIKAGVYREKLSIPRDKPYIILQGEGMRNTVVEWNDHLNTAQSPTFCSESDNIVVKLMTFRNTYNDARNGNQVVPAVAAMIMGDMSYFYSVGFIGFQDTLWDVQGRHYYKNCFIQGAVDFIFGAGQSLFETCSILSTSSRLGPRVSGIITAQGRTNQNDANGFVFKNCKVYGDGTTYLGRPWRAYARVLFYNTSMSKIVQPLGWEPWHFAGREGTIHFSEYGNFGPGSNTHNRVKWMKNLDIRSINAMASLRFIDQEGWLSKQLF